MKIIRQTCALGLFCWIGIPRCSSAFLARDPFQATASRKREKITFRGPLVHFRRYLSNTRPSPRRRASARSSSQNEHIHHANENDIKQDTYLATCIPGLANVLASELTALGCCHVQPTGNSAVRFTASMSSALDSLLWTRTAHKILQLLAESSSSILVYDRDTLYQYIRNSIVVQDLLGDGQGGLLTLRVQVILNNKALIPEDLNHSHFTALTIKNALVDAVRELKDGDRPNIDLDHPDVPLVVVLRGIASDEGATVAASVAVYRQLHQGSLHKRGYRSGAAVHKAAMKESMAAGLLLQAGWSMRNSAVLVDPMAGSGSLLLEAAMMAADLAPGLMRIRCGLAGSQSPPVLRWKHDSENILQLWRQALLDATKRAKSGLHALAASDIQIHGNDIHPGALDLFESALDAAGLAHLVQVHEEDCLDWKPPIDNTSPWMVVTNPPWGVRLTDDMHESWEALRVFLREICPPGSQAWVLSGNAAATKHLGLRKSQSLPLKTGQQDLRWIQYIMRDKSSTEIIDGEPSNVVSKKTPRIRQQARNGGELSSPRVRKATRENPRRVVKKPATDQKATGPVENEWLI